MDNLPFEEESFDIIWAEGASIIGIEQLSDTGKIPELGDISISDIFWFTKTPSEEPREFFAEFHPTMITEDEGFEIVRNAGLELVGSFRLPSQVWEESFYGQLRERFGGLEEEYADDKDALMVIDGLKKQTDIFDRYSDEFGNTC